MIDVSGVGDYETQPFAAPQQWKIHWTFDCRRLGRPGRLLVVLSRTLPNGDLAKTSFRRLDVKGRRRSGVAAVKLKHPHQVVFDVITECVWQLRGTTVASPPVRQPTAIRAPTRTPAPVNTATHVPVATPVPTATTIPTATPVPATPAATPIATSSPVGPPAAPQTINPSKFALSLSDFPAGSVIRDDRVESNQQARNDALLPHFGGLTWDQEGRLSGYLMSTLQGNPDASGLPHPTLIYYLVSIFGGDGQAANAWNNQRQGWLQRDGSGGVCGNASLGDSRYVCVDAALTDSGYLAELYFRRGRVLVEVWVYATTTDFNQNFDAYVASAVQSAHDIALTLDAVARQEQPAGSS
ncbi:MAG: hypothetical protein ACR2JC_13210 [Chloroflexota bacterium]